MLNSISNCFIIHPRSPGLIAKHTTLQNVTYATLQIVTLGKCMIKGVVLILQWSVTDSKLQTGNLKYM